MRRYITALILGLALLGVAWAQQSATITLRSGQTINAQLIDLSAVGFTIRESGNERQIPKNDVLVIDFGGGAVSRPSELDNLGGQHLIVLRNGDVVRGEFVDIGGSQPLRLTFRTSSGERDFSSNDARRIYLGKPPDETPTPLPAPVAGTIAVPAAQQWTPTNITVRRGQTVRFEASGEIELDADGQVKSGPGGSGRFDKGAPLPSTATGTLIGRVDSPLGRRLGARGQVFVIGNTPSVVMPADGPLYLGVNDSELSDNRGRFQVKVTPGEPLSSAPVRRQ